MSSDRGRHERDEVVTSSEMRDSGAQRTRGTTTESYVATPTPATTTVRQETVRQQPQRPDMSGTREVEIPEAYNLDRDRVRWGPIIAGLVTALTTLLALTILGLAIGLTAVDAERAAREGGVPLRSGIIPAIWGALSTLLAFFLGGLVAGRTAAVFDRKWGGLNGMLVFLLAVPLTLFLATAGIGGLIGTLGNYASGLNIDPAQVQQQAQGAAQQAQGQAQQATPEQIGRAAENARNGAWSTLLGLGLGTLASWLGGMMGTRRELEVDRQTGNVHS
jgi:hypothetical protein